MTTMQTVILEQQDYLRVTGPDARKFLQGQASCNMDDLTPAHSLRGVLCNLKGRVVADFRVFLVGDDILLQTQAGMGEIIESTLAKYAVFSKVTLELMQGWPKGLGFCGVACEQLLAEEFGELPTGLDDCVIGEWGLLLRVGRRVPRFELIRDSARVVEPPPALLAQQVELAHWHCAAIRDGEVHVTRAMSEAFTPQLLNYDISGAVDFNKGCYTGQEVVARMYYRGKAKQRMFLLCSDSALNSSDVLRGADGKEYRDAILTTAVNPNGDGEALGLAVLPVSVVAGSVAGEDDATNDEGAAGDGTGMLQICGKDDGAVQQVRVSALAYS
ncbi:MAG: YgfZ/GcvT domain-containing protein [Pseudohongiellaceae bacterium]